MTMSLQSKRRPFGTSAANAANIKERQLRDEKSTRSIHPLISKAVTKQPRQEQTARSVAVKNANRNDKGRESKTPKMHNLSSVGGAYNFEIDFVEKQVTRNVALKPSNSKPDPSPIKRPDPSVKSSHTSLTAPKNGKPSAAAPKKKPSLAYTNQRVSSGVSTIPPKEVKSSAVAPKLKSSSTTSAPFKSSRHISNRSVASSSRRSDRDASSDMDVDTECSSPEKTSPLVTSPYYQPDPDAMELTNINNEGPRSELKTKSNISSSKNIVDTKEVETKAEPSLTISKTRASIKTTNEAKSAKNEHLCHQVSKEVLAQARNAPADNKRVVDAMLNSNGKAAHRNDASQTEASGPSLVGSTVGGSSLQRSASVDGSEVTMPSISHASKIGCDRQSMSEASVFRRPGSIFVPSSARSTNISSNFTASINDLSSGHFLRRPTAYERKRLSSQIESQLQSGYTYPSQIHLPAGWQVRMSKSKGKPYYVHPDFGSTWHYPGLIIGPHIAVQNELFMDQSVDVSRFTSQASAFQKNNDASNDMRSASEIRSVGNAICNSIGPETIDIVEEKNSLDVVSSAGKRSDDAVLLDNSISSQAASSNTSQSKCLTQNTFVNSHTRDFTLKTKGRAEHKMAANDVDVNSSASSMQYSNNDDGVAEFETQHDALGHNDVVEELEKDDSQLSYPGSNDGEFGNEQSNCDDSEANKDRNNDENISSAKSEEGGSLEGLDPINDIRSSKNSILSTNDFRKQYDTNSLASDHIDVDALLRHGTRGRHSSPLATIKEIMRESSGRKSMSSQVSLDGSSDNDRGDVHSSGKSNKFQTSPSDNLSQVSDNVDKSTVENVGSQSFDDDTGDEFDNIGFDLGGDGFSDEKENQTFDNFDNNDAMIDEHVANDAIEVSAKNAKRKRRRKSLVKKERRKTFPPGPLCSLQMLDLIEDGSLDTPLWRNGKRKRSTLTSMKRARANSRSSY